MTEAGLVERVLAATVGKSQVHGSELHELVMAHYQGRRFADSYDTERVLDVLERGGVLRRLEPAPTPSQRAFAGLTYSTEGYRSAVRGTSLAGLRTHFWYAVLASGVWPR